MTRAVLTAFLTAMMAVSVSGGAAAAPEAKPAAGTYTWSAELVAVDPAAESLTFKARVAYPAAFAAAQQLAPGSAVHLIWSGAEDFADAIREVKKADAGAGAERFSLPGTLVATDAASQYVTVRVKAPTSGLGAIQNLKAGEWVTVTARHQAPSGEHAVVAIRPYNTPPSATT